MEEILLTIPFAPVSLNDAYGITQRGKAQKYLRPEYKRYKQILKDLFAEQGIHRLLDIPAYSFFEVTYLFVYEAKDFYTRCLPEEEKKFHPDPITQRKDVTNSFKLIEDALFECLGIDDSRVIRVEGMKVAVRKIETELIRPSLDYLGPPQDSAVVHVVLRVLRDPWQSSRTMISKVSDILTEFDYHLVHHDDESLESHTKKHEQPEWMPNEWTRTELSDLLESWVRIPSPLNRSRVLREMAGWVLCSAETCIIMLNAPIPTPLLGLPRMGVHLHLLDLGKCYRGFFGRRKVKPEVFTQFLSQPEVMACLETQALTEEGMDYLSALHLYVRQNKLSCVMTHPYHSFGQGLAMTAVEDRILGSTMPKDYQGEAIDPPYNAVSLGMLLHYHPDPTPIIREVVGNLRPGGKLLFFLSRRRKRQRYERGWKRKKLLDLLTQKRKGLGLKLDAENNGLVVLTKPEHSGDPKSSEAKV